MNFNSWFIFLLCVLAATATPGPAVLFAMTTATLHGLRKTAYAALGNISGLLLMGTVAVTGLGVLLNASEWVFELIKYCGAAYLIYLGVRMFRQKGIDLNTVQGRFQAGDKSTLTIYFQAMGVALSNPKAIIFLTALFPQFIDVDQPLTPQFLVLIGTLMFFSYWSLIFYALLACKARLWLLKPSRMKAFNQISGGLFIAIGTLLAFSRR